MSRSRKGSKGPGYEYWGRRPCKLPFTDAGPETKKFTHRAERRQGKQEAVLAEDCEPHWEHGYRCHGYWVGTVRWGWVGLGPRGVTRAKRDGYSWGFSPPGQKEVEGHAKTLREGKMAVEAAYRAFLLGS